MIIVITNSIKSHAVTISVFNEVQFVLLAFYPYKLQQTDNKINTQTVPYSTAIVLWKISYKAPPKITALQPIVVRTIFFILFTFLPKFKAGLFGKSTTVQERGLPH